MHLLLFETSTRKRRLSLLPVQHIALIQHVSIQNLNLFSSSYLLNRPLHHISYALNLLRLPDALRSRNRLQFQERVPLRLEEVYA
jgi:hypothetical protein